MVRLAGHCPRLETLELRAWGVFHLEKLAVEKPCVAKPRHFSLTSQTYPSPARRSGLLEGQAALFDHATTLEFKIERTPGFMDLIPWITVGTLARLLKNPAVEKLTVHGLWGESGVYSISAPSLTHLDLLWSKDVSESLRELDAPELLELAIDAQLLDSMTSVSTLMLSSLTLRIVGLHATQQGQPHLDVIDKVKQHQGVLKLVIGRAEAAQVLQLLLDDFLWQGLEQAELDLAVGSISAFVSVFAARQAGARGATEQQYLDILQSASSRLGKARLGSSTSGAGSAFVRRARDIMATVNAVEHHANAQPLCSHVHWRVSVPDSLPLRVMEWLKEQPNIDVQVWRSMD